MRSSHGKFSRSDLSKDGFEIPTQETTAGATTATTTGGPTYPTAEFGLDERPANPTCVAPERPLTGAQAELVRVYPGVSFNDPIWIGQIPGVVGLEKRSTHSSPPWVGALVPRGTAGPRCCL